MPRRHRGSNTGLLMLLLQIYQFGFNNIHLVTLSLLGLNIYLFLYPMKPLGYVCISVNEAYYNRDWERFLLSPFHHADDWHLYFNMVSLLWKGTSLERSLGSLSFAIIIATFSQLIGALYVLVQLHLAEYMDDKIYKMQCGVGFSGVLFALKVLNNHFHPGGSTILFGFEVPDKYSCWAELLAIHLLSPGTSFVGHLSGILVGLSYTLGPLQFILDSAETLLTGGYRNRIFYDPGYLRQPQSRRNYSEGPDEMFTGGLSEDEQLQEALRESLNARGGLSEDEQLQEALQESLNARGHRRTARHGRSGWTSSDSED